MQYLLLAIIFMVWLALVISFARSRSGAKSILVSRAARIDIFHKFHSNDNNGHSFNAKQLNSISTTSDSGHESTVDRKSRRNPEKMFMAKDSREKPQRVIFKQPNNGTASPNSPQRSFPRQNLSGRRVLDSERTVHNRERDRLKQAVFPPPKDIFEELNCEFRKVIRSREFEPAMALYARMKEANYYSRESVLTGLLSICQKKEHLRDALAIFKDFAAGGIPPNESAFMSLIRCYSDDGQITEALALIEQMSLANLELKLRSYHPVLEAICKNNDFDAAMIMIKQMHKSNVVPRSEQLTLLLQVSATSGAIDNEVNRKQIDEMLLAASLDLLGMETEEMRRVVGAFCDLSPEEVLEEGILIETRDDLPGEILDINDSASGPVVTAMNSTYANVSTLLTDMMSSPAVIDNTIPIGYDLYSYQAQQEPDIFTIASESEALGGTLAQGLRNRRARLVDISRTTCLCPNCGAELIPLLLDEEERKRVRLGLMKIASTASMNQLRNIQAYGEWLKLQHEFKYIIDGANVAYNHQNFEEGKFSYRQIELVVDRVLARGDGKVLVLLPYSYAQKIVPNSSKQRGKRNISYVSPADQRIIQRFDEEGMLYLVPQGADDDWYWIYATVTEGRTEPAYVVRHYQESILIVQLKPYYQCHDLWAIEK